ncbi:unnamed protein product [Aphis gossypii]|uniref:Uncharacterized protein n=1 Tax=Aphis gossypii TaxID=80765 RepID=A0A9P0NJZ9_APHGO|nr:unnamed protein product [Aphis gossypii]
MRSMKSSHTWRSSRAISGSFSILPFAMFRILVAIQLSFVVKYLIVLVAAIGAIVAYRCRSKQKVKRNIYGKAVYILIFASVAYLDSRGKELSNSKVYDSISSSVCGHKFYNILIYGFKSKISIIRGVFREVS